MSHFSMIKNCHGIRKTWNVCHSFAGRLCQLAPLRWQHRQTNRRTTGKLTLDRRPSWYRSCFQSCLIWANLHFFRCRLFSHHRTASPTFSFIGDNTFKQFFLIDETLFFLGEGIQWLEWRKLWSDRWLKNFAATQILV